VVELGGYPDFSALYRELGFEPLTVDIGRKAIAAVRSAQPAVVVAEFNLQREFRDRTSGLESLLALAQGMPQTRVIAIYDAADAEPLGRLRARFAGVTAVERPLTVDKLRAALTTA
jgi:ActR/RegA family two-component response regulator